MPYDFTVRQLPAQPALVVRREVPLEELRAATADALSTLREYLKRTGARPAGDAYARYLRFGGDVELEAGYTMPPVVPAEGGIEAAELPAGEVVATLHRGPYERLPDALAALEQWLYENGRIAAGPHWECYRSGPPAVTDPQLFQTEIFVPLEP